MVDDVDFEHAERLFEALHAYEGLEFSLFDQLDDTLADNPRLDQKTHAIAAAMSRYRADMRAVADELLAKHRQVLERAKAPAAPLSPPRSDQP